MAIEYTFLGTNIDATLLTDGATGNKTFTITELRGFDPTDIMGGINFVIEEYNEADLIRLARTNNLTLNRVDRQGLVCLVVPAAAAGRFNGRTSRLRIANVTLASSGTVSFPLIFRFTFRVNRADVEQIATLRRGAGMVVSDLTLPNLVSIVFQTTATGARSRLRLMVNGVNKYLVETNFDLVLDMCNEIEVRLNSANQGTLIEINHNGNMIYSQVQRTVLSFTVDDFTIQYGANISGAKNSDFFSGIMRNLVISDANGDLVNIIDPSTGTNTGSEADGTPTDVTSVSVIF